MPHSSSPFGIDAVSLVLFDRPDREVHTADSLEVFTWKGAGQEGGSRRPRVLLNGRPRYLAASLAIVQTLQIASSPLFCERKEERERSPLGPPSWRGLLISTAWVPLKASRLSASLLSLSPSDSGQRTPLGDEDQDNASLVRPGAIDFARRVRPQPGPHRRFPTPYALRPNTAERL